MSPDLTVIQRDGYTILDILSDVGGLQGILISLISLFISMCNYNHLNTYIASKLFRASAVSLTHSSSCDQIK